MIQTAYIIGRMRGIDIREHGSGNAGMTNVSRILGRKLGFVVFGVDIAKTVGVFIGACLIFASPLAGLWGAAGVILGHNFPAVLKFRGGKGVACTIGLIIVLDWRMMLIVFAIGVVVILVSRYVSVTSLWLTASAPVVLFLLGREPEIVAIMAVLGALAWFMHRDNIGRLWRGEEQRIGKKT
jgi:glycerol-3-phosphate acyltransferase PlsY